jgi:AraC-like DNA-binding protein
MPEPPVVVAVRGHRIPHWRRAAAAEHPLESAAVNHPRVGGDEGGGRIEVRSVHPPMRPRRRRTVLNETAITVACWPGGFPGARSGRPAASAARLGERSAAWVFRVASPGRAAARHRVPVGPGQPGRRRAGRPSVARCVQAPRQASRGRPGTQELAVLAAQAGYADQAHLTRECRALAGLTPSALARQRAPGQDS